MAEIHINLLTSRRERFLELSLFFLNRIKEQNKKRIKLNIIASGGSPRRFNKLLNRLNGIEYEVQTGFSEYLDKIAWAAAQDCKYQAKLDEDVFVSEHVLDFMLENLNALDESQNLTISPLFSNGIPTVDQFIGQFLSAAEQDEINSLFLKTVFAQTWGVDYSFLNEHTTQAKTWNPANYYASVARMDHYLKGIHPVRLNAEAQLRLNQMLRDESHIRQFVAPTNLELQSIDAPYLCNNFFFIRNDIWNAILKDKALFRDAFDEIPLSLYKQQSGKRFLFVKGGFAIHTMYNSISSKENDADEVQFFECLRDGALKLNDGDMKWRAPCGLRIGPPGPMPFHARVYAKLRRTLGAQK